MEGKEEGWREEKDKKIRRKWTRLEQQCLFHPSFTCTSLTTGSTLSNLLARLFARFFITRPAAPSSNAPLLPLSLSRDHPTSFGPLVFSTQVHRKAGSFFTRRTFSLCPFFLLFYLFLSHTTHVPFSFFSFFSSSPFSVTFFYRSFLRRFCFFFLFLVLVLTFFLFLFGFFLAATVVWNSNRGSIWRHPS